MTYMCNKCMGNLLNVRSRGGGGGGGCWREGGGGGGGGGGGVRRQELTQLHFIFFFDIITVNSLRGTPLELPLSVYLRKMFIVHV